jgi:benzylsuccinate CoA-transferase BbsF subunit
VLAALYHRSKTGEGQYLDLSMVESELAFAPEAAIEYAMNGKVRGRVGNRDDVMAPHGCYRCKGVDKWVAIAVSNDEEWVALCKSMGNSELAKDKRFSDALCRRDNQDELDRLIEDWTRKHDHYEVMKRLQEAGVMAGASLNIEDLGSDPHLKERGFLVDIEYPDKTKIRRLASPLNLSSTGRGIYKYAPALGEHNRYVFGELMGMSDEEIKRLENEEVLY